MPISHTNRKGDTYHLHQGTTKTGKPKYYFAKKEPDTPVDTIPEGYEIYENPNGQVFLRRVRPKLITDAEVAIVEQGIANYTQVVYHRVDVKGKAILIYLCDQDYDELLAELDPIGTAATLPLLLANDALCAGKRGNAHLCTGAILFPGQH